ncbi:TPA: type II toxin-antitoxin system RnlB family antitoxin [Pseudomonas aeruginosa]|nr:type II toxin-antitoxin system RnlB family antitoxin [Pseudomonas aeruginosa]HBN9849700.1 type II toxin-antitoxin system RnlB family antitoxin [Pseudomonas aeruginosa]
MIPRIRIIGELALITANADFHPLDQLKKLSTELESNRFKGSVLFDLISTNGLSDNRFISIIFDGHNFDKKTFSLERNISSSIKKEQDSLIKKDPEFLRSSVLSRLEIEQFLH